MAENTLSATRWVDQGGYFTRSNGQKIFYHRDGRGDPVVLLHGFPTWSFDYASVAQELADTFDVIAPDFLGYGYSDKPKGHAFSVKDSADMLEEWLTFLGVQQIDLVIHDYGGIVGQELVDRRKRGSLSFRIKSLTLLNFGIDYASYRPTRAQKLLANPLLGGLVASRLKAEKIRAGLDAVRGDRKMTDAEFSDLWSGISEQDGHKLAHRHIRYNAERAEHSKRWEAALFSFDGPVQLIWGMADPVSGAHVLNTARPKLRRARITELPDVGHFPQAEAPECVAATIREFLA